jgi:hypothetical protein
MASGRTDLTVALVPTGIKAGVWISPWGVVIVPTRASEPSWLDLISKEKPVLNGSPFYKLKVVEASTVSVD